MTKFRHITPRMAATADKIFADMGFVASARSNPGPEMTDFERSLELMRERGDVYEPTPFDSTSGAGGERGQAQKARMAAEYSKYPKANPAQRTMQAMRNGTCPLSGEHISMGDSITKTNAGWVLTRHAGRS